jgi:hypothetical protein
MYDADGDGDGDDELRGFSKTSTKLGPFCAPAIFAPSCDNYK